jgi:excisionase family DNA binding protein
MITADDPPAEIANGEVVTASVPMLIDAKQIARLLGISKRHLARLVHDGEFPRPLRLGTSSRWSASDYNDYVTRLRERQDNKRRSRQP